MFIVVRSEEWDLQQKQVKKNLFDFIFSPQNSLICNKYPSLVVYNHILHKYKQYKIEKNKNLTIW